MLSMWWLEESRVPAGMAPNALVAWAVGQDKEICEKVRIVGNTGEVAGPVVGPSRFATIEPDCDDDGTLRRWEWRLKLGGDGHVSGKALCRALSEKCDVKGHRVAPGAWLLESVGISRGAGGQSVEPYNYLLVVGSPDKSK